MESNSTQASSGCVARKSSIAREYSSSLTLLRSLEADQQEILVLLQFGGELLIDLQRLGGVAVADLGRHLLEPGEVLHERPLGRLEPVKQAGRDLGGDRDVQPPDRLRDQLAGKEHVGIDRPDLAVGAASEHEVVVIRDVAVGRHEPEEGRLVPVPDPPVEKHVAPPALDRADDLRDQTLLLLHRASSRPG